MMKNLPLFYYPNKWLWVDDDLLLLNSMAHVFSAEKYVQPFQSSQECLNFLKSYQSPLSKQSFLKSNKQDESYGILQKTPVDFDITSLASLADDQNRQNEITVMVIDYNMPDMDGFSLAQSTNHLSIQKILLTGKAQESQVITGFNGNLIHRFVQKSEVGMFEKLSSYLKELSLQYFQKITLPLLSHLETETKLPLSDPIFIEFFKNYCERYQIKEYYLIDKQGRFLCIDILGNRSYLAVQSDSSIKSWLAMYGDEKALPRDELTILMEKKKIPFFGIGKEAWQIASSEWPMYFHAPKVLEGRERYYWVKLN